ncbi:protein NEDD1-like isoform X2 [Paramacrobiotus metropolitanus]|uniref:protein NEDD1-like isoform X2 n=1 Tax=Paramacrobiotus metropolitanus TaxID=2943436 RepID=UPI0024463DB9|nr:protein NEDD1-like isoform X2 [Paramacrobiotus metropolitanus]
MAAYFLSAGDSLKVWDAEKISVIPSTSSTDFVSVVRAIWSPKGDCIAVVGFRKGSDVAKIYLLSVTRNGGIGAPVEIFAAESDKSVSSGSRDSSSSKRISRTLVAFGNGNGQIVAGANKEGLVQIFDRKTTKITTLPASTIGSEIKSILFNADDTALIIADAEGDLWFRSTKIEQSSLTKIKGQSKAVLVLQPFPIDLRTLICGHESGAITFLDTIKKEFSYPFESISTHLAACNDIAFSHTNPNLAASVGMDNQIIIFHIGQKKILNKIMSDCSLYSILFLPTGNEILCGTSTGKILLYNLTKDPSPQRMFMEHNVPVVALAVQPQAKDRHTGLRANGNQVTPKVSLPVTDLRQGKRGSNPEVKDAISRNAGRVHSSKPSVETASISLSAPFATVQRIQPKELSEGVASQTLPVMTLSPNITVRNNLENNASSPIVEPADTLTGSKPSDSERDSNFADQLQNLATKLDSAAMEHRVAVLDIRDMIYDYEHENCERLIEAEKKIGKLQEDTAHNTALLELIFNELTAIRKRLPYL